MDAIPRIHHISAIVGDPNENLKFYRDVLGLRLIKQTVNFQDPSIYHLYFSDQDVTPGTIMTFFPWTNKNYGRKGSGQGGRIAFKIPKGSLDYWYNRLISHGIQVETTQLFSKVTLSFEDSHGLELALVESPDHSKKHEILGFYGTVLLSANPDKTKELLTEIMGLKELANDNKNMHVETVGKERHHIVIPKIPQAIGRFGIGTVHHIAWSVPNIDILNQWRLKLKEYDLGSSLVMDRNYFKSIYTKENGKVVFEFATDGPGFEVDEAKEELGSALQLPEQYESKRSDYESMLVKLEV